MSPHINFLEKKGFNLGQMAFNYFFILVSCGAFLFFMIAFGLVQKIRLGAYENKLAAKLSQVEALQGMKQPTPAEEGSPKRIAWAPVLNAIGAKTGEDVWIQSLSGLTTSNQIEIEGEGAHWQAVSRFEKDLETMPFFREVSLLSSEKAPNGNIVFKIRGFLK